MNPRILALASALALAACASHPQAPATAQSQTSPIADGWGPWSAAVHGVRCRVKTPPAAKQGDVVSVAVELDVRPDQLPAGSHLLDPDLRRRKFGLELEGADGIVSVVRPYDPYSGMPPDPPVAVDPSNDLLAPESRTFAVEFPLATQWDWITTGNHFASMRLDFKTEAAGFWTADLTSAPFQLRVEPAEPREEVVRLPKTLRLENGAVVFRDEDLEDVRLPRRNGFTAGLTIARDDNIFRLESGGDVPSLRNPIEAVGPGTAALGAAYTLVVFETADAPEHLLKPNKETGSYRELWRRTIALP